MSNLKYKQDEQYLSDEEWSYLENQELRELLVHIAQILASEYIDRMKRAPMSGKENH